MKSLFIPLMLVFFVINSAQAADAVCSLHQTMEMIDGKLQVVIKNLPQFDKITDFRLSKELSSSLAASAVETKRCIKIQIPYVPKSTSVYLPYATNANELLSESLSRKESYEFIQSLKLPACIEISCVLVY